MDLIFYLRTDSSIYVLEGTVASMPHGIKFMRCTCTTTQLSVIHRHDDLTSTKFNFSSRGFLKWI